ncbi:MAG: hypothetical protein ACE5JQ_03115 [Candidatus Methylomirabilales bacterium]
MRQKELWGLQAICAYMGWRDPQTPLRALDQEGFLMFRLRRGSHGRTVWYSNSELIRAWMASKRKVEREKLLWRELLNQERKGKGRKTDRPRVA